MGDNDNKVEQNVENDFIKVDEEHIISSEKISENKNAIDITIEQSTEDTENNNRLNIDSSHKDQWVRRKSFIDDPVY